MRDVGWEFQVEGAETKHRALNEPRWHSAQETTSPLLWT